MTRHSFGTPSRSIGFFRYWPSHCHLQSGLGVIVWHPNHLSLCDHTKVLLQYAQIRYFSTSFCYLRLRYAHCSYFRSYIRGTTHTEGSASWLPWLWLSELCLKTNSHLYFMRHLHLGVTIKIPLTRALQKVRDSLTWWWHSFSIHCLTITLSQSLVLNFCYPF